MTGCDQCSCYRRGMQDAAYLTYLVNIATTAAREELEKQRQTVERWHEQ